MNTKHTRRTATASHHASRITHHGNGFMYNKFLPVLTFCAMFFLAFAGVKAQSNVEYNFRQQSTAVGSSFGFPANFEEAPNLTMSCLAANGYGQWTLSSSAGSGGAGEYTGATRYPAGWYLLANGLYTPSTNYESGDPTDYPGCYPPGVVQDSALTFPTEVKAITNLSGMAGFVWPEQVARQSFVLYGFTAADFNLSLSFLTNPSPVLALGTGNTDIVTHTIHSWPSVSTSVGLVTHAITSASGDWRDNFDVCSDAYYNYFIWTSSDHPVYTGQTEVWVMAVPIGSSTPAFGPTMVDDLVHHDGQLPTITCDPRNNRSGTPAPAFDLAYIQLSTNNIMTASYSGVLSTPVALTKTFWDTNVGSPGSALPWGLAYHARIVRNSVYGGTSSVGIYATVNRDVLAHHASGILLAYYAPGSLGGPAAYVAGDLRAPPTPIPFSGNPPVKDGPIIAFADPYDNQANWHETDETHSLYQYDLGPTALPSEFPLCIVRGCDVTADWPDLYSAFTPDASTQDTRLVLNQSGGSLENDPTANWYVGAVNQMGIHVHWIAPSGMPSLVTHFYARDTSRTFDEPIDENTLETDICTVSDGSSTGTNHGGTVGATLQDGQQMAIWTDPNYGANVSDLTCSSGLYQPGPYTTTRDNHVGQLDFIGNNVILTIGEEYGATLTDMPYFYFHIPYEYAGQGVTINDLSVFDYYGLDAWHNSDGSIYKLTTPFNDDGLEWWYGAGTITLSGALSEFSGIYFATLNIHGGSDFTLGEGTELLSTYGRINALYDGEVFPMESGNQITGHASLHGYTSLAEESEVIGNVPATDTATIITILGYEEGIAPQFDAESSGFWNTDTNGASIILAKQDLKCYNGIKFHDCSLTAMNFHAITAIPNVGDPTTDDGITFTNDNFYEQHGRTIFIENLLAPTGLDEINYLMPITIESNHFYTINHTLESAFNPDGNANEAFGIYIKGLDGNYEDGYSDLEGKTMVESNVFTGNNWSSLYTGYPTAPNFYYSAAICFENTTGNILGNTISDPGYSNGIWLHATLYDMAYPTSRTFICSNTIENLYPRADGDERAPNPLTGIRTEYYNTGYIKLNTISNCEIGLYSNGDDGSTGSMLFNMIDNTHNSITWDVSNAIVVTSNSSLMNKLDLSGIHTGGNDVAGFNTVAGTYSNWTTGLLTADCNSILNVGSTLGLAECPTCSNFGQNNFQLCTGTLSSCGSGCAPTVLDAYTVLGVCGTGTVPLSDVDFNFWGLDGSGNPIDPNNNPHHGVDPENWNITLGASQDNALNITYSWPVPSTLSSASSFSDVTCGSSLAKVKRKNGMKIESLDTLSVDSCQRLLGLAEDFDAENEFSLEFDTAKYTIEHCVNIDPVDARGAVGKMSIGTNLGGNGPLPQGWVNERTYLLSLFQLRPSDGLWLCGICNQLLGSMSDGDNDTSWQQVDSSTNRGLSLMYWLIHNSPCSNFGTKDSQGYVDSRQSEYESYLNWPGLKPR